MGICYFFLRLRKDYPSQTRNSKKSVADYCRCYSNEGQRQTNVSENVQYPFICLYRINEQSFNANN